MDYGKLAYLRLDELEARISNLSGRPKIKTSHTVICPGEEIKNGGECVICDIGGSGGDSVAVIIKFTLNVFSSGVADVFADGMKIGAVEAGAEGKKEYIVINSIRPDSAGIVKIRAGETLHALVETAEVALIGGGAAVSAGAAGFSLDENGAVYGMLLGINGALYFSGGNIYDIESAGINKTEVGTGRICDITEHGGVFYAVYCDVYNNLFALRISSGGITRRAYLGEGADSVALTVYKEKIITAYVKRGSVFHFTTDLFFGAKTAPQLLETAVRTETVRFVKRTSKPVLILTGGGKSFLKDCEDENTASGTVGVKISVSGSGMS